MDNQNSNTKEFTSAQDYISHHHGQDAKIVAVTDDKVIFSNGSKRQSVDKRVVMEANDLQGIRMSNNPNSRMVNAGTRGSIDDNSKNGNLTPQMMTREQRVRMGHDLTKTHSQSMDTMDNAIKNGMSHDDAAELTSMSFGSNSTVRTDPEIEHNRKIAQHAKNSFQGNNRLGNG